jgi:DNA-binding XRE family transcriptional regulator
LVIYNAIYPEIIIHFGRVERKPKNKHLLNEDYCKAFGAHLRKLREEKGFGLREFAAMADMEYSTLSKIERGVTNTTLSTALHLAETLGIQHTELFQFKFVIKTNKDK